MYIFMKMYSAARSAAEYYILHKSPKNETIKTFQCFPFADIKLIFTFLYKNVKKYYQVPHHS